MLLTFTNSTSPCQQHKHAAASGCGSLVTRNASQSRAQRPLRLRTAHKLAAYVGMSGSTLRRPWLCPCSHISACAYRCHCMCCITQQQHTWPVKPRALDALACTQHTTWFRRYAVQRSLTMHTSTVNKPSTFLLMLSVSQAKHQQSPSLRTGPLLVSH